jgi:hypothetical protein
MDYDDAMLLQLMLLAIWTCLSKTPLVYKNPLFLRFMVSLDDVRLIASNIPIFFAPGLWDVVNSATPPAVAYFKSLPSFTSPCWAVYLLVLEKAGRRPRIYVGVATNAKDGVAVRFKQYDEGEHLPRRVESSLAQGFEIVNKGLLCWTSIPTPGLVPITRLFFYAMEATFACMLWAMNCAFDKDFGMGHMCLWDRSILEWDGLCTHSSLNDGIIGDFDLTNEDLELIAKEKERKFREHKKINACNYHYKQMETNYDEYMNRADARVRKSRALHPEKHRKTELAREARTRAAKTHYCLDCDKAFSRPKTLENHLNSAEHARKIAPPLPDFCHVCNKGYANPQNLSRHNKTQGHRDKIKAAAQSSSELD